MPPIKPNTVSFATLIPETIISLKSHSGSSRSAIVKAIVGQNDEPAAEKDAELKKVTKKVTAALKKLVSSGTVVQVKQSFKVVGQEFETPVVETVTITDLTLGHDGPEVDNGDTVIVSYIGTLQSDGSTFDEAEEFEFTIGAGEVIKGWEVGVLGMRFGGIRKLIVPSSLGYGKRQVLSFWRCC